MAARQEPIEDTLERLSDDLGNTMDEMNRRSDRRVAQTNEMYFQLVHTWPPFLPEARQFWRGREEFWETRRTFWAERESHWRERARFWMRRDRAMRRERALRERELRERALREQMQQTRPQFIIIIRFQY